MKMHDNNKKNAMLTKQNKKTRKRNQNYSREGVQ